MTDQPKEDLLSAEEILSKHTGETGIYLTKGLIRGSDALDAMQEFSCSKDKEIAELKKGLADLSELRMLEISALESEIAELKEKVKDIEPFKKAFIDMTQERNDAYTKIMELEERIKNGNNK